MVITEAQLSACLDGSNSEPIVSFKDCDGRDIIRRVSDDHVWTVCAVCSEDLDDELAFVSLANSSDHIHYEWSSPDCPPSATSRMTCLGAIQLEEEADIVEKITQAFSGQPVDPRIMIGVDIPEDLQVKLMKIAHNRDITLNQLINGILADAIPK